MDSQYLLSVFQCVTVSLNLCAIQIAALFSGFAAVKRPENRYLALIPAKQEVEETIIITNIGVLARRAIDSRGKVMPSATTASFSPDDYVWKGLTLTDSAARQIITLAAGDAEVKGLRLGVKTSGCAGFGYTMDLIKQPEGDDLVFTHQGASLFVPLQAMPFIDGTEVDFVREGLNQIFKFNNPKAQHACGCGESFGVE